MEAITKLLGKTKGNKALLAGSIIGILTLAIVIGAIVGAILILGLNLIGFAIPYTIKTILGAAIIISCLRSIGGSSSK
jgi:hypothetical protein